MVEQLPDRFVEIVRLSDAAVADSEQAVTANSNPEMSEQALADYERQLLGDTPEQELYEYLSAMNDESFRELMGWALFGRDYTPNDGDPYAVLGEYVRDAVIYPRDNEESYLAQKPIGEYVRKAWGYMLMTSEDLARARSGEDETGEEYGDEEFSY